MQKAKPGYNLVKWYYGKEIEIPVEWSITSLGDSSNRLENGLTYTHDKNERNGIPISRIETISFETIDDSRVGYVEKPSQNEIKKYSMNMGDILFSHINSFEHVGKTAIYLGKPKLLLHGMNLIRISVNPEKIISNYLIQLLKFHPTRERFRAICNAAINQVSINTTQLIFFKLITPPLSEQQKIAYILSNIDNLISSYNSTIETTKKLKTGLMQTLLTKGIGHKKFKNTKLGKIPEEWEVVKMSDVATIQRGKFSHRPRGDPDYFGGEYPFIQTGDIENSNGFILNHSQTLNEKGKSVSKVFPEGIIVLTIVGAKIGNTAITTYPVYFPDSIVGITSKKMHIGFLETFLQTKKNHFKNIAINSARENLNLEILQELKIPFMQLSEQKQIFSIFENVDAQIRQLHSQKSNLKSIKKGLMQKLLTGQIRVKV